MRATMPSRCVAALGTMARSTSGWGAARAMQTAEAACRAIPAPANGAESAEAPARVAGLPSAAASGSYPVGGFRFAAGDISPRFSAARILKRDRQQRIDLAAVEDHGLLGKKRGSARQHHPVEVASGREQRRVAGVHDARDHEIRARADAAAFGGLEAGGPENVTVALRLIDIRLAQRLDAVAQHGARGRVDDRQRQALLDILRCGDAIFAMFHEEVGPLLEATFVDRLDVARIEV